jgi:putative Mg2+ transporter-C (MgtC) family protein
MEILSAFSWDWELTIVNLLRLIIAFVITFPIAWQRLRDPGRDVGFRTFPIVAVASCGYLLLAKNAPGADAETQARALQGLLSGMGFIGGGAILKEGGNVRGLAIAASIWNVGAIGAAVAYERLEIAVALSLLNFLLLRVLTPVVMRSREEDDA